MCAHENAVRTPEFGVQADANGGRIADDVANTVWRVHDAARPRRLLPRLGKSRSLPRSNGTPRAALRFDSNNDGVTSNGIYIAPPTADHRKGHA